jgi:hypothetical protein
MKRIGMLRSSARRAERMGGPAGFLGLAAMLKGAQGRF